MDWNVVLGYNGIRNGDAMSSFRQSLRIILPDIGTHPALGKMPRVYEVQKGKSGNFIERLSAVANCRENS